MTTAAFIPAGPARSGPRSPAVPKVSGPANRRPSSAMSPASISASISARSPSCGSSSAQARAGVEHGHGRSRGRLDVLGVELAAACTAPPTAACTGSVGVRLAVRLDQRLGVDLGVVGRLVAERPGGGEVPPVARVVRDAPDDGEAGRRRRQRGVDQRDGVGGGEPGGQHAAPSSAPGTALPIRRQTTSMPYRSTYSEPSASIATFATP